MSEPLIAGLMPLGENQNQFFAKAFNNLRTLSDKTIILADKVEKYSGGLLCVDEVTTVHNGEPWNDAGNRITLLARGAAHGLPWCVWLDSDEVFEPCVNKQMMIALIRDAVAAGCDLIEFQLCEMWTNSAYRVDGIWGQKRKVRVQRNPLMQESVHWRGNHLQRLHAIPMQCGDVYQSDIRILHYGMSTPELREARVKKHNLLDPNKIYQPQGYDYMLDTSGMVLKEL